MRQSSALMAAAFAAVALLLAYLVLGGPLGADHSENGAFANDCCGTLQLADGQMVLNGKPSVRYAVGRDRTGPYVLPSTYVGPYEDRGFEIDGSRPAMRLRLDRLPRPTKIALRGERKLFVFKAQLSH
jgi:hypothetical protein